LFCGEEFNEQLTREKTLGKNKSQAVENYNIIDFGQDENNKLESFQKKLEDILQLFGSKILIKLLILN
jgi:hypothetical protein